VSNQQLIERFVEYLIVEKGRAPLTIKAYRDDLGQLSEFFGERRLVTARCQDLRNYIDQLLSTVAARSIARKQAAFRHFFKFLLIDKLIVSDQVHFSGGILQFKTRWLQLNFINPTRSTSAT